MNATGFALIAGDWRIKCVSDESGLITGSPASEAVGRDLWSVVPSAPDSEFRRHCEAAMAESSERRFESGTLSGVTSEVTIFPTDDGIGIIARDIGERPSGDRELKDACDRTLDLIQHAPTGICEIDLRAPAFVTVNDTMCALTGYTRQELLAMDPFELLDEESRVLFRERIAMSLAGAPVSDQFEYRVNRKDDQDQYVILDVKFLDGDNGEATSAFIIGHDVTQLRRMENETREARARLRAVLENVGDIVSTFDLSTGAYSLVSHSMSVVTGFTPDEVNNMPPEEIIDRVHPDDRDLVIAQREMLESGVDGVSTIEYRWKVKSGEYRWLNSRRNLLRDNEGIPTAIVGVSSDITERKRREADQSFLDGLATVFQSNVEEDIVVEVAARMCRHIEVPTGCALEMENGEVTRALWSPDAPDPELLASLSALVSDTAEETPVVVRDALLVASPDHPESPDERACIAVMNCRDGECRQLFAVVSSTPRTWRQDEIDLVTRLGQRLFPRLERARAEEALRKSEEMYRKMVTTASEGLWLTDTQGKITFVNRIMADWLGYDVQEMLGRNASDFTFHEGLADSYAEWSREGEGGTRRYDFKLRRKDGSAIWLIVSGTPLEGAGGVSAGNLSMFMDISERKRAEQSLAFHARLLECVHDAICAIDPHDRIIYWNDMAESMFGWSAADAIGRKSADLIGAVVPGSTLESEAGVGDAYCSGEVACRHKDGREIHASVNATVVRGENQEITQIVASFRDMTERKQAADALKHSHLVLETELMRTTVLRELASAVASSLDSRELSERALLIAQERMGCDAGCIYMLDDVTGPAHAVARFGYVVEKTEMDVISLDANTLTSKAMRTGKVQISSENEAPDITRYRESVLDVGPHRFIGLPIVVRGTIIGGMGLSAPGNRAFSSDEVELYEAVAQQLSVGFENARLYETEHRIAETLQETLVLLPSRIPGVTYSRAYESAAAERGRVGGDFFDIFEIHGPTVGIVIGDVSGKGVDAAVITSLIRNTVRAHAIDGIPPADLCAKTNLVVHRFTEIEEYATMFFGVLNTRTGVLRYVIAGHPPALMAHADGECDEIGGKNLIIGAFEKAEFCELQTVMRSGDRLILYTDGVTEARSPHGHHFFELNGLKLSVRENAKIDTARLARMLMQDVVRYSDGVLRDDAAILAVQATKLRSDECEYPQLDFG